MLDMTKKPYNFKCLDLPIVAHLTAFPGSS